MGFISEFTSVNTACVSGMRRSRHFERDSLAKYGNSVNGIFEFTMSRFVTRLFIFVLTVLLRIQTLNEAHVFAIYFSECLVVKNWPSIFFPLCVSFCGICCFDLMLLGNSDVFLWKLLL